MMRRLLAAVLKFVPVIVITVPTGPKVGVKAVIVGTATVKFIQAGALPLTVRQRGPLVAYDGTMTTSCVAVAEVTPSKAVYVPLNVTESSVVVVLKFVPVIVIDAPTTALVGATPVIVGTGTVKLLLEQPVEPNTVMQTGPVTDPCGTVTTSCVAVAELTAAV